MQRKNFKNENNMDKVPNIVYIVDDDFAMLESLTWLLESIHLNVKSYSSGPDFLEAYQSDFRGCILIDVLMPFMTGLQLQEKLVSMGNTMPIIMLSGHGDIPIAVNAIKAGAIDFITKPFNDQILIAKVQNALDLNQPKEIKTEVEKLYNALTIREHEVMKKMVEGKSNKIIAADLNISNKTVELHRTNLMKKMGTKSLASLVKMYCLMEGPALTLND